MKDFKNNKIIYLLSAIIIILIIVIFILILKDNEEEKDLNQSLNTTLLVYLENISQPERNNIEKEILNTNNIYEIKYESKEEFVDNIKKEYSYEQYPILNNEIDILKHLIESNKPNELMIYDTYLITLKDATKLDKTIKEIENIKNVKQVKITNLDNTENENKDNLFNYLNENNSITVSIKSNVSKEDILDIEKEILNINNIYEIKYKSKEEFIDDIKKEYPKEQYPILNNKLDTLKKINELNMYDTYKIKLKDITKLDKNIKEIENIKNVKQVKTTNLDSTPNENKENLFNYLNENNTIVVFLKSNVTIEDTKTIEKEIRATNNVEELTFISKQEAANNMKEDNETFSAIIETWTDETNPLLDSFKLKIKDILKIDETVKLIKNIDKVENVQY